MLTKCRKDFWLSVDSDGGKHLQRLVFLRDSHELSRQSAYGILCRLSSLFSSRIFFLQFDPRQRFIDSYPYGVQMSWPPVDES